MNDVISLIIESAKTVASTIKNSSRRAKQGMFACVAVLAIFASLSFTGTRIAYNVSYKGNIIATVGSKKQFDDAVALVSNMVDGDDVSSVVSRPTFNTTVVLSQDIDNTETVANAIINNTSDIVAASTLFVDGQAVARAEKATLDAIINERLNMYNAKDSQCTSSFEKEITISEEYIVASDLDNVDSVKSVVNSLNVITEMRQVTDVMVPYKSTTQKTNEQVVGYAEVAVAGVSGVNRVTQEIVMVNGQVVSDVVLSTETVVAPVNEVILKGTAKSQASAAEKQFAHSAGFIFPLPAGTWRVSSYYGDGRNHKGVDICAKGGTSIYAVLDGKVIHSGWRGGYGYCVMIEHENGLRTLYAHARQLCCKVGDSVSQGEVIALVGTTGQSTGNHLHFEVISNGRNVDPAPYIALD
ncbi:MAG: peptidoglycan DD-metalloendopeptidase family protein [Clostridia bacterium]|nr:peptidoglycan DD-metalloendopeptidase family protein [Clostridia bacterium]